MNGLTNTVLRAAALHLNFQDFFEEVGIQQAKQAADKRKQEARNKPLPPPCFAGTLPDELLIALLSYLQEGEILRCRELCSATNLLITSPVHDNVIWEDRYNSAFPTLVPFINCSYVNRPVRRCVFRMRWVEALLLETKAELRHCIESQHLIEAASMMPPGDVIGLVGNIGRFNDPKVAVAVSLTRYQAMDTIVIRDKAVAMTFKAALKYAGPVSFCSISNGRDMSWITHSRLRNIQGMDGLIGYAIELIELRPEEEYLRYTALLLTYGRLSIWETFDQAKKAQTLLQEEFPFVALDVIFRTENSKLVETSNVIPYGTYQCDYRRWCEDGSCWYISRKLEENTGQYEYLRSERNSKCHVSSGSFRPRDPRAMLQLTHNLLRKHNLLQAYLLMH